MHSSAAIAFILGACLSAAAAAAHLACIALGAPAYRIMGAGERMARAVEQGSLRPTVVTLAIAAVLSVWAAYAFGAAGLIPLLPFSSIVLPCICAVNLARALGFPLLRSTFPENSRRFWLISSGICLVIGLLYLYGIVSAWQSL